MSTISGVTQLGKTTSLKQLLATLASSPPSAWSFEAPVTHEYSFAAISQARIKRFDSNPKGGNVGARKFQRAMKAMVRNDLNGVLKSDPLVQPDREISKRKRHVRLGYAPSPRSRSSNARGRKAAVMRVFAARLRSRRVAIA